MQKPLKNISINIVKSPVNDNVEFNYNEDDEDADLIKMVEERIKNDNGVRYTWEEFKNLHSITDKDLEGWEEVEFE